MKYFILLLIFLALPVLVSVAAVGPVGGLPTQAKAEVKNRPTVNPTRTQNRISEQTRLEMEQRRGQIFLGLTNRLAATTESRLENYGQLLERVRSRKEKMTAMGKDVTRTEACIVQAETNRTNAVMATNTFRNAVGAIDMNAVSPEEARKMITTQLQAMRQAMVKLHTTTAQCVREMKGQDSATPQAQKGSNNQNNRRLE